MQFTVLVGVFVVFAAGTVATPAPAPQTVSAQAIFQMASAPQTGLAPT
jgi:hypothetical protein